MKIAVLATAYWLLSLLVLPAQSYVLLQTATDGKTSIAGDSALLKGAYSPASTFKLLIAQAALEQGIATPETRYRCADRGGQEVDMAEAMYFSSNDYFRWLGLRLDRNRLNQLIAASGWGGTGFSAETWLAPGGEGIERGGDLLVTVAQEHDLILKLMQLKPDRISRDLRTVMRRPWNDPDSRVYGKSGAWGGAIWMTGYYEAEKPADRKAVTVFVPYKVPAWKPAREIAQTEFYRALGIPRPKD